MKSKAMVTLGLGLAVLGAVLLWTPDTVRAAPVVSGGVCDYCEPNVGCLGVSPGQSIWLPGPGCIFIPEGCTLACFPSDEYGCALCNGTNTVKACFFITNPRLACHHTGGSTDCGSATKGSCYAIYSGGMLISCSCSYVGGPSERDCHKNFGCDYTIYL